MTLLKSKTIQILLLALTLAFSADLAARGLSPNDDVALTDRLEVQPVAGGVYLLGNSMFKTGIDVGSLRETLGDRDTRFAYFNGHYSSLWYLIAEGALGPSEVKPEIVVWGFRPRFAALPAYRQNQVNSTELFEFDDPHYRAITEGAVPSPGIDVAGILDDESRVYAMRSDAQETLSEFTESAALATLDRLGHPTGGLGERLTTGTSSIADEIVRAATNGQVALTEEQVVDGVGDFIAGPTLPFAEGFVPLTARSFQTAGQRQLVIIWRPVDAALGRPSPADETFVTDAIAFFQEMGIPYVDLYSDPRIEASLFASGDHYNADGRSVITELVASRVAEMLAGP